MAEKKKVWLVTEGAYSDYHIEGVFSTRQKAEQYAATKNIEPWEFRTCHIEEYVIDDITIEGNDEVVYVFEINRAFKTLDVQDPLPMTRAGFAQWLEAGGYMGEEDFVILPEPDAEKALKIASDRVAREKAHESGISN